MKSPAVLTAVRTIILTALIAIPVACGDASPPDVATALAPADTVSPQKTKEYGWNTPIATCMRANWDCSAGGNNFCSACEAAKGSLVIPAGTPPNNACLCNDGLAIDPYHQSCVYGKPPVAVDDPDRACDPATPIACNATVRTGGLAGDAATIELGRTSGTFSFQYQTYDVADQLTVFYQDNGQTKAWTTGCVNTPDPCEEHGPCDFQELESVDRWETSPTFAFSGSDTATVVVHARCAPYQGVESGWAYKVACAG